MHSEHLDERFIGYALNAADELVHVDAVYRGVACNCRCVACGQPVLARQGEVRAHHFAHVRAGTCDGGAETLLHRLAKDILCRASTFRVPAYRWRAERLIWDRSIVLEHTLVAGGVANVSRVDIEQKLVDGLIPDAVLWARSSRGGQRPLIVEIAVSHRVGSTKLQKLKQLGYAAIEIHLHPHHAALPPAELENLLLHGTEAKQWLFHPLQNNAEADFEALVEKEEKALRAQARARHELATTQLNSLGGLPTNKRSARMLGGFFSDEPRLGEFVRRNKRYPSLEESRALFRPRRARSTIDK